MCICPNNLDKSKNNYNTIQVSTIVLYQVLLMDKACIFMLRKIS